MRSLRRVTAIRLVGALLSVLAVAVVVAGPAGAHDLPPTAFSRLWEEDGVVRYDLTVRYTAVAEALDLADPADPEDDDDAARAEVLEGERSAIEGLLAEEVRLFLDGVECLPTLTDIGAETNGGEPYALLSLRYECHGTPAGRYEIRYHLFLDDDAEGNLVDYDIGGEQGRSILHADERRLTIGGGGPFSSGGRFVVLGVEHIVAGLDHVLFVLALLIGARSIRGVLEVATAFTAAHSVTLALAGMGWVHLPAGVVEPLIALSIAYVAVENIRGEVSHRRQRLAVFAFGLLHGLGFASTLSFTDDVSWRLLSSLLTFNIGIELGQAAIILAAAPLLVLVRRLPGSRPVQVAMSGAIGAIGLYWTVERLFG